MRIDSSTYSIANIRDMITRKELRVNLDYQRGAALWPIGPRSYFIDTILNNYPFPKIYFHEFIVREDRAVRRDIVDGQQRIRTMLDFLNDKFAIRPDASENFGGMKYSDLDEYIQETYLQYPVAVDTIRNATVADILEMFRRMNAYTLPLNGAEKRHSRFQGPFKWYINRFAEELTEFLVNFQILSSRQFVRMADQDLLADVMLAIREGIITTKDPALNTLYKRFDDEFPEDIKGEYTDRIMECIDFMREYLGHLRGKPLFRSYVFHSLCTALLHNKYGLPAVGERIELEPIGAFFADRNTAIEQLEALSAAHEMRVKEGPLQEYVWSCASGTNSEARRAVRVRFLSLALRGDLEAE